MAFISAIFAAPLLGEDPATYAPAAAAPLLGADSATWTPTVPSGSKHGLLGADSATWAPAEGKDLLGADSAMWSPHPLAAKAGCDSIKGKDACDKNDKCSWCLSGAVPPACKTLDEAKQLPPAVFQCDNLS